MGRGARPGRARGLLLLCVLVGLGLALWQAGVRAAREGPGSGRLEGLAPEAGPGTSGRVALGTRAAAPGSAEAPTHAPGEWPASLADADPDLDLCGVVVDASGRAIAGARLRTWIDPGGWGWGSWPAPADASPIAGPHTMSGPDGAFRLRLVRGEPVSLVAEAAGLAPWSRHLCYAGERLRVVLGPGTMLRLRAFDPQGRPAAGVRVRVEVVALPAREVLTNEAGEALDGPVGSGQHCSVSVPHQALWSRTDLVASLDVPEGLGEVLVEFGVQPTTELRGRITNALTGASIEGASVGLGWEHEVPTTTDAEGRYVLKQVPQDREYLTVSVRAAGYARREVQISHLEYLEHPILPDDLVELDVELVPEARAAGRVVDAEGAPIEGALVAATLHAPLRWPPGKAPSSEDAEFLEDWAESNTQTVTTGPDGSFALDSLDPSGRLQLEVLARGHAPVEVGIDQGLVAGRVHDLGTIVLGPARTLSGRVVGSDGAPRPDARVQLSGPTYATAGTDALGRFCVTGLAPGEFALTASAGAWMAGRQTALGVTLGEEDVEGVTLVLPESRRILLDVRDEGGRRVPIVSLDVHWAGGWETGRRLETGDPALHLPAGARDVEVVLLESGRDDVHLPMRVAIPDGAQSFTARVSIAHPTRGLVLDPKGHGVTFALVEALRGDTVVARTSADFGGRFRLRIPGTEAVDLRCEGEAWLYRGSPYWRHGWVARVSGAQPGSGNVILRGVGVPEDGVLRIQVLAPDGTPAPGCRLRLPDRPGEEGESLRTDVHGRVEILGLAHRAWRPRLEVPTERALEWFPPEPPALYPQEGAQVIHLLRPRPLRVLALDDQGARLPDARITAWVARAGRDLEVAEAWTHAGGVASLPLHPALAEWVRLEARAFTSGGSLEADPRFVGPGTDEVVLRLGAR